MNTREHTCEVSCQSHVNPDSELNGYANVILGEMELGEVAVDDCGQPFVRVNVLPRDIADLIEEKELTLLPEGASLLVGQMTPREKQPDRPVVVRGAIDTTHYPEYEPLRALCRVAMDQVAEVKADLRRREGEQRDSVLALQVPVGMVQVCFQSTASAGYDVIYQDPDGRLLRNPVIAGATVDGAEWMEPQAHAAAAEAYDADRMLNLPYRAETGFTAEDEAREPHLFLPVPPGVLHLYRRTGGNPELVPETIENPDYRLLRQYAPAIERQGLAPDIQPRRPVDMAQA